MLFQQLNYVDRLHGIIINQILHIDRNSKILNVTILNYQDTKTFFGGSSVMLRRVV